jgi:hypothetical protein
MALLIVDADLAVGVVLVDGEAHGEIGQAGFAGSSKLAITARMLSHIRKMAGDEDEREQQCSTAQRNLTHRTPGLCRCYSGMLFDKHAVRAFCSATDGKNALSLVLVSATSVLKYLSSANSFLNSPVFQNGWSM